MGKRNNKSSVSEAPRSANTEGYRPKQTVVSDENNNKALSGNISMEPYSAVIEEAQEKRKEVYQSILPTGIENLVYQSSSHITAQDRGVVNLETKLSLPVSSFAERFKNEASSSNPRWKTPEDAEAYFLQEYYKDVPEEEIDVNAVLDFDKAKKIVYGSFEGVPPEESKTKLDAYDRMFSEFGDLTNKDIHRELMYYSGVANGLDMNSIKERASQYSKRGGNLSPDMATRKFEEDFSKVMPNIARFTSSRGSVPLAFLLHYSKGSNTPFNLADHEENKFILGNTTTINGEFKAVRNLDINNIRNITVPKKNYYEGVERMAEIIEPVNKVTEKIISLRTDYENEVSSLQSYNELKDIESQYNQTKSEWEASFDKDLAEEFRLKNEQSDLIKSEKESDINKYTDLVKEYNRLSEKIKVGDFENDIDEVQQAEDILEEINSLSPKIQDYLDLQNRLAELSESEKLKNYFISEDHPVRTLANTYEQTLSKFKDEESEILKKYESIESQLKIERVMTFEDASSSLQKTETAEIFKKITGTAPSDITPENAEVVMLSLIENLTEEKVVSAMISLDNTNKYEEFVAKGVLPPVNKSDDVWYELLTSQAYVNANVTQKANFLIEVIQKSIETFGDLYGVDTSGFTYEDTKEFSTRVLNDLNEKGYVYPSLFVLQLKEKAKNLISPELEQYMEGRVREYRMASRNDIAHTVEDSDEIRKYLLVLEKRDEILNAEDRGYNPGVWGMIKETFAGSKDALIQNPASYMPFISSMISADQKAIILDVLNRKLSNEATTPMDDLILDLIALNDVKNAYINENEWYLMGKQGVPKSVSFMIEMALGQMAMRSLVNHLPKLLSEVSLTRVLGKGNLRGLMADVVKDFKPISKVARTGSFFDELNVVAREALTLTGGNIATSFNILEGYLDRIMPHSETNLQAYKATGDLLLHIKENQSENAFTKALASNLISVGSEHIGRYLGVGLNGLFWKNPANAFSFNDFILRKIASSPMMSDLSKKAMLSRGLATFARTNTADKGSFAGLLQSAPMEGLENVIDNGAQVLFLGERDFEGGFLNESVKSFMQGTIGMSPIFGIRLAKNFLGSFRSAYNSSVHVQTSWNNLGIVPPGFNLSMKANQKITIRRNEIIAAKEIIDDLRSKTVDSDNSSLEAIRTKLLGIANPSKASEKGIIKGDHTRRALENTFLFAQEFFGSRRTGTFGDYLKTVDDVSRMTNQSLDIAIQEDFVRGRYANRYEGDYQNTIEELKSIRDSAESDIAKRNVQIVINTIESFLRNRENSSYLKDYVKKVETLQNNIEKRIYNSKILGKPISLGSLSSDIRKLEEITGENSYALHIADLQRSLAQNPVLNFDNAGIFLNERTGKTYREEFDAMEDGDQKVILTRSLNTPEVIATSSTVNGEKVLTLNITEEELLNVLPNLILSSGVHKQMLFALSEANTVFSDGKSTFNFTLDAMSEMITDSFDNNSFSPAQLLKGLSVTNKLLSNHPGSSNIDVTDLLIQNFRTFDIFGWKRSDNKYYVDEATYKAAVATLLSASGLRDVIKRPHDLIKETSRFIIVSDDAYEQYTGKVSDYLPEDVNTDDVEEFLQPAIKKSDITIDKVFSFENMKEGDIVKSLSMLMHRSMGISLAEATDYAKMLDRVASGLVASGLYQSKQDALKELPLYEWSSAYDVTNDSVVSRLQGSHSKKSSAKLFFEGVLSNLAVKGRMSLDDAKRAHRINYIQNDLTEDQVKSQAKSLLGLSDTEAEAFTLKKGNGYHIVLFGDKSLTLFDQTANHESLLEASVRLGLYYSMNEDKGLYDFFAKGKTEDQIIDDILFGLYKGRITVEGKTTYLNKGKSILSDRDFGDKKETDAYLQSVGYFLYPNVEPSTHSNTPATLNSINIQTGILKGIEMKYDATSQKWTFFKGGNPVSFAHAVADWYYDKVMKSLNNDMKNVLSEAVASYLSKIDPSSKSKSAKWYNNEVERIKQFNPGVGDIELSYLINKSVFAKAVEMYMSKGSALRISEINNSDGTTSYRNIKTNTPLGKALNRFAKFFSQYSIDNIDDTSSLGKGITTQAAKAIGQMFNVRVDSSDILKDHDAARASAPHMQLTNKDAKSSDQFKSLYNYVKDIGDGIREEDLEMAKEELRTLAMKVKQEYLDTLIKRGERLPFSKEDLSSLIFTPRGKSIESIKDNLQKFEEIINDASKLEKISDLKLARKQAKNNFENLKKKDFRFYKVLKDLAKIPVEALTLDISNIDLLLDLFSKSYKNVNKNDYEKILQIAQELHQAYLYEKNQRRIESDSSLKTKASIANFLEQHGLSEIEILNLTNQRRDENGEFKNSGLQSYSRMHNPESLEELDNLFEEAKRNSEEMRKSLVNQQMSIMSRGLLDGNNIVNDLALEIDVNDLSEKELTDFSSMLAKAGETGKFDTAAVNFIFDYHAKKNDTFIKNSVGRLFKDMLERASDPSGAAFLRKNFHWLPFSLAFEDQNGNKTILPRIRLSLGSIAHLTLSQMADVLDGLTYNMKGHVSKLLTEPLEIAEQRRLSALSSIMAELGELKKDMTSEELTVTGIHALLGQKASFSFKDFFELKPEDLQDEYGFRDQNSEELFNLLEEVNLDSNAIIKSEIKAKNKFSYNDFYTYDSISGTYVLNENTDTNSLAYRIYEAMNKRKTRNIAASIIYSLNGRVGSYFPEYAKFDEKNSRDRFDKVKASNMRMHNLIVAEGLSKKYGSIENLVNGIYEGSILPEDKMQKLIDFNRRTFMSIRQGAYSDGVTIEHVITDLNGQPFSAIEDYTPLVRYDEVSEGGSSIDKSGTSEMSMDNTNTEGSYLIDVDVMKASLNVNDTFLKKRNGSSVSLIETDIYEMLKRRVDQELFYLNHEPHRKLLAKTFSLDNGFFSKWKTATSDTPANKFDNIKANFDREDFRLDENASREFNLRFAAFYLRNMTPSKIDLRRNEFTKYVTDVSNSYKSFLLSGTHASVGQLSVLLNLPPEFMNSIGSGGISSMVDTMEGLIQADDSRFNQFLIDEAPEIAFRGISEFDYANINYDNLADRVLLMGKMVYGENSPEMKTVERIWFRIKGIKKGSVTGTLKNLFEDFDRSGSYRDADVLLMNVLAFDRLASKAAFYTGYKAFVKDKGSVVDWANPDRDGVNYAINLVRRTQNSDSSLWRSGVNLGIMPGFNTYNKGALGEIFRQQFFSFRSFAMNEATNQRRNAVMSVLDNKYPEQSSILGFKDIAKSAPQLLNIFTFGMANKMAYETSKEFALRMMLFVPITAYMWAGFDEDENGKKGEGGLWGDKTFLEAAKKSYKLIQAFRNPSNISIEDIENTEALEGTSIDPGQDSWFYKARARYGLGDMLLRASLGEFGSGNIYSRGISYFGTGMGIANKFLAEDGFYLDEYGNEAKKETAGEIIKNLSNNSAYDDIMFITSAFDLMTPDGHIASAFRGFSNRNKEDYNLDERHVYEYRKDLVANQLIRGLYLINLLVRKKPSMFNTPLIKERDAQNILRGINQAETGDNVE